MAIIVKTESVPLFKGEFYGQAQVSYTTDTTARTFTVKIDGVRAYCKYGWNFTTHVQIGIADNSSGTNRISKSGDIQKSGSSSYKGWLPKSGYETSITCSKTFRYTDQGTAPQVWIYVRMYNTSILWLKNGSKVGLDVSANTNISSQISAIAAIPPKPTVSITSYTATRINWKVTTDVSCSNYEVYIDGSKVSSGTMNGTSASNSVTVSSAKHNLYVKTKRAGTSTWGTSNTVSCDCTVPSIYNASITPTSVNSGILKFTSNYKVDYYLTGTFLGTVNSNTNPSKSVSLTNSTLADYNLTVKRKVKRNDNTNITNSTTIKNVDTRPAKLTLTYKIVGTSCVFSVTSDVSCSNWYYVLNGTTYHFSNTSATTQTYTIEGLTPNKQNTLYVYATKISNNLKSTSNTIYPIAQGCSQINISGQWKPAAIFIYDESKKVWNTAIPYIYQDGSWHMCS